MREGRADGSQRAGRSSARRWVFGTLILLGGILLLMGGIAWKAKSSGRPGWASRLPDGTTVRLEAVTFGTRHRFEPGLLPLARLRQGLPFLPWSHEFEEQIQQAGLVFWLTRRDGPAGRYRGFEWWSDFAAVDRHGCRFAADEGLRMGAASPVYSGGWWVGGGGRLPPPPPGSRLVVGFGELQAFPRRDPAFRLRLYGDKGAPLADFTVPNPTPRSFPRWTPQPLPATQRDGDLAVTLTRLIVRPRPYDTLDPAYDPAYGEAEFRFVQNGRPTREWEVIRPTLLDATGNACPLHRIILCPHEPAWKLRARFIRTARAGFSPHEVWTVQSVPAAKPGAVRPLIGETRLQGVSLRLLAVAGAGTVSYLNGVPQFVRPLAPRGVFPLPGIVFGKRSTGTVTAMTVTSLLPHVAVGASPIPDDCRLTLRATDDQGRLMIGKMPAGNKGIRFFNLDIRPDARKLTLSFAVHRARAAEFLIRPPRPKESPAAEGAPRPARER